MELVIFLLALVLGGIAAWQVFNWKYGKKLFNRTEDVRVESTVLLERIEQVFKVVLAEGYFTEIYDHSTKKDVFGLFQTNKKALVVAKAKVAVGFDFSKMKFRRDESDQRKLIIEEFAPAEIISIDTDYKFYDVNQGWLNRFNNEDYTSIIQEAKKMMQIKATESDLSKIASNQVIVMMKQLGAAMKWDIVLPLPENQPKSILQLPPDDNQDSVE